MPEYTEVDVIRLGDSSTLRRLFWIWLLVCSAFMGSIGGQQVSGGEKTQRLAEACAAGKLNQEFVDACHDEMREYLDLFIAKKEFPADFFDWLGKSPELERSASAAIAEAGISVALNLQRLREIDERMVLRHPQLAVAFAAAWLNWQSNHALYWADQWLLTGRQTPTMEQSFADVVAHYKEARFELKHMPWQVLAHLADSLTPIEEREWARKTYQSQPTVQLRGAFAYVPYTLDPQRGDRPCTLQSYVEVGGPCTHNVQFAGGVFDAFGIPSGWAGGPGHTYPYWFEYAEKKLSVHRTNEIGNRNGKIRNPYGRDHIWEDHLRLDVAGFNHSADAYQMSVLAAWAFRTLPVRYKSESSAILLAGLRANPHCRSLVDELLAATQNQWMSPRALGKAWAIVAEAWADHPHLLIPILDQALPAADGSGVSWTGDMAVLKKLEKAWQKEYLRFALPNIDVWKARCLQAQGKTLLANSEWERVARAAMTERLAQFQTAIQALAAEQTAAPTSKKRGEFYAKWLQEVPASSHVHRLWLAKKLHAEWLARDQRAEADWVLYSELLQQATSTAKHGGWVLEDHPSLVATETIGGGGGGPFAVPTGEAEVIGLRLSLIHYNGRDVVASMRVITRNKGNEEIGEVFGREHSRTVELRVEEGWRICGIVVCGSDRVDGIRLLSTPTKASETTVRFSKWAGTATDRDRLLGGIHAQVDGLHGRAGAEIDAIGLLFRE